MGYNKKCGGVVFNYDADDLFDRVAMLSSYVSRTVKSESGEYAGEEVALTHDEDDVYLDCFKQCANDFVHLLPKMVTDFDVDDVFCVSFDCGCAKDKALKMVDSGIEEFLKYGVLKYWFTACGSSQLSEYCSSMQSDVFRNLWDNMFDMRNRGED